MPLPMVHLLLANRIAEKSERVNNPYFILGSIAPDAIHARLGTNRTDKHKTHMFINGYGNKNSADENILMVKKVLESVCTSDKNVREFVNGYCIHTMLDMEWITGVFNVLAKTFKAGGITFNDVRTKYYYETNLCDSKIYFSEKWIPEYVDVLKNIVPVGFFDLLTGEEIGLWRDDVLGKMRNFKQSEEDGHYISYRLVVDFVNSFSNKIIEFFKTCGYEL